MSEQDKTSVESTQGTNKPEKSKAQQAQKAADAAKKVKDLADKAKSIEALAPLVTALGVVIAVILLVILLIGFIAFFVTLPGLVTSQFIETAKSLWDNITGNEEIEIKEDNLVNLANYIETLGYDIEGFGFATANSVIRENEEVNEDGSKSKITSIKLAEDEIEYTEEEKELISAFQYMMEDDTSSKNKEPLEFIDNTVFLPRDVLRSANIVSFDYKGENRFCRAVDQNGNNTSLIDDSGKLKKMQIDKSNGYAVFTNDSQMDKTLREVLVENKMSIKYYSYNDYKRAKKTGKFFPDKKSEISCFGVYHYFIQLCVAIESVKDPNLLANCTSINKIKQLGLAKASPNDMDIIEYVKHLMIGDGSESSKEEYKNFAFSYALEKLMEMAEKKDNFKTLDDYVNILYDATEELVNIQPKITASFSVKRKNLYAYILSNERTYTAVETKKDHLGEIAIFVPSLAPIAIAEKVGKEIKKNLFPQGFGMLKFPKNDWELDKTERAQANGTDFSVSIDRDKDVMTIKTSKVKAFGTTREEEMAWKLSGWTSRYGKPIELSLALHLSTFAPQFVYDFCMDKDLQTEVLIRAHKIKYDVEYTYQKYKGENGKYQPFYKNDRTVTDVSTGEEKIEKGIISTYESIKEALPHYYRIKDLFTNSVKLDKRLEFFEGEDGYTEYVNLPIDVVTNNVNIVSLQDEDGNIEYYKAVDRNKNPVQFTFFSNSTPQPYTSNPVTYAYHIEFNGDEPYFIKGMQGTTNNLYLPNMISSVDGENGIQLNDGRILKIELLGFKTFLDILSTGEDGGGIQNLFYRRPLAEDLKYSLTDQKDKCIYQFARLDKYITILENYDKFINDTLPNVILNTENEKRIYTDSEIETIRNQINKLKKYTVLNDKMPTSKSNNEYNLTRAQNGSRQFTYVDNGDGQKLYILGPKSSNPGLYSTSSDFYKASEWFNSKEYVTSFLNIDVEDTEIDNKNHYLATFLKDLVTGKKKVNTTEHIEDICKIYTWTFTNHAGIEITRSPSPIKEILRDVMDLKGVLTKYLKREYDSILNAQNSITKNENNGEYNAFQYVAKKIVDDKLKEVREKYGIQTIEELETLYVAFKDLSDDFTTYKPYIDTVTHHWYRDLKFGDLKEMDQNTGIAGVYKKIEGKTRKTQEFSPSEGTVAYNEITALKENAEINYTLILADGDNNFDFKQMSGDAGTPQINKTQEWHYKVKNWLLYGYYFIYDGTTNTAQQIESARSYLTNNYGFNEEDPLLIDSKYINQKNLFDSGTNASKIDAQAKLYNDALAHAHENDPTIKEPITARLQKIKFDKSSSLAAFSILEGMHTEDSEYIYRELKEYLIELNYFTRADFETMEKGVLRWLLPSYSVYKDEWPDTEFEKSSEIYGSFVRSSPSLSQQRKAKADYLKKTGTTTTTTTTIPSSGSPTSKPVEFNGITYMNYKQGDPAWANHHFSEGTMSGSGCNPTSGAILLSGFGYEFTPDQVADEVTNAAVANNLDETGRDALKIALENLTDGELKFSKNITFSNDSATLRQALEEGRPACVGTALTGAGHIICLIGMDSEGLVHALDPRDVELTPLPFDEMMEQCRIFGVSSYIVALEQPSGYTGSGTHSKRKNQKGPLQGFNAGLNVIAPENAKIVEIGTNEEARKLSDNNANPEDPESTYNANDYFTTNGEYITLQFKTGNAVNNWKMMIEGLEVNEDLQEGKYIAQKKTIGKTTDDNLRIVLYDDKDAIIDDVEDYFKLRKRNNGEIDEDMYEFFFFTIYESGALDASAPSTGTGPECVGACRPGAEHGAGICQWTTMSGCNNIAYLCGKLYEKDPELCKELQKYASMDTSKIIRYGCYSEPENENAPYTYPQSKLRQDFWDIAEVDRDRLWELEMEIAYEDFMKEFDQFGLSWMKDRPPCVQGTLASLLNWGPYLGWETVINPNMDDEEIIISLCQYACGFSSTVGSLNHRWNPQAKLAIDILDEEVEAEEVLRHVSVAAKYCGTYGNFLSEYDD